MNRIVALGCLLTSFAVHAGEPATELQLANGTVLTIREIASHRGVPFSYYDQAMESIPRLYPHYVLILTRRIGNLGGAEYSLVCYKETPTRERVRISGAVRRALRAWSFSGEVPVAAFDESLVLALEAVSNLSRDP